MILTVDSVLEVNDIFFRFIIGDEEFALEIEEVTPLEYPNVEDIPEDAEYVKVRISEEIAISYGIEDYAEDDDDQFEL